MGNKLYILQGPPASGKSTLARKIHEQDPEGSIIVSRDAFRHALGTYWVPSREDLITKLENEAVIEGLRMGYDIILDNTNLNPKFLAKWEAIAHKNNVDIQYIKVKATFAECLSRDKNPDRSHQVGERTIRQFFNKYNLWQNGED